MPAEPILPIRPAPDGAEGRGGGPAGERAAVEPLLLTSREAARFLHISGRKLWQLTADGAVPCVRLGRAVRYDRRDLIALIDTMKRGGGPAPHRGEGP
jgi:excisionase family DNA binding protein